MEILKEYKKDNVLVLDVKCECGKEKTILKSNLKRTKSCGCLKSKLTSLRFKGVPTGHGETYGNLYYVWTGIKQRCYNEKHQAYPQYGGRGVEMDQRYKDSYVKFAKDIRSVLGDRPKGMSLDRINNEKGYFITNLRWANQAQQLRNNRQTRMIKAFGKEMCVADWVIETGISRGKINWNILKKGKDAEEYFKKNM